MSPARPTAVVVLAAGEGTRMRSATPKVLHEIGGRSLLAHAVGAARGTDPDHLVVVVRHARDQVAAHVAATDDRALVADQDDVPGTGRAVQCGLDALAGGLHALGAPPLSGTVLVTYGDVPLLTSTTLLDLVAAHEAAQAAVTLLTTHLADPTGYGRVVRGAPTGSPNTAGTDDALGPVERIVEQKDATPSEAAITEVNSGIYAFDADVLARALPRLGRANAQGEVYLTDVVALARADGHRVQARAVVDAVEVEGVNDRVQLSRLGAELNRRVVTAHQRAGATVVDPATTWIDVGVTVGRDTTLLPGVQLHGATSIADGATVGPDTTLVDVVVGSGARVVRSHATGAVIGPRATVGPFSYLRPGTQLAEGVHVGAFVETKNALVGAGSKVPHLSYVGDAQIGEGTNIGAATIFANYDGVTKSRTVVGDHVFVGSDTVLVAPLTIGDGAYTAAGSVVTDDVPAGSMAVARGRQKLVGGWVERRRAGTRSAAAARAVREGETAQATAAPTEPSPPEPAPAAPRPSDRHGHHHGRSAT